MDVLGSTLGQALPWVWLYFVVASTFRLLRILRRPYKADRAPARGDSRYGAFYALTFAMLPWKKESTRTHWITYTAGMLMHLGIFAVILFAFARLVGLYEAEAALVAGYVGIAGLVSAVGLFVKRSLVSHMRAISSFDDFFSNLLVDFYLLAGVLTAFDASMAPLWQLAVVLLLVWIPIGKIFHMVLFFVSRILFGLQFGRRGVIRHAKPISY